MIDSDRGRAALSAAEDMAFGGTDLDLPRERDAIERSIATVTDGTWWRSCGPVVTVSSPRGGTRFSRAHDRASHVEIQLSDEQLTLATAAHELAHALAGVGSGHDLSFRAAYVDVIAVIGGAAHAAALAGAFHGLRVRAGVRRWPAPYWTCGEGFVVTSAGSASIAGGSSPSTLTATPMRGSR